MQVYFGSNYFGANYFGAEYFAEEVQSLPGPYWATNYWGSNYWGARYWSQGELATGGHWSTTYWGSNYWGSNYWAHGGLAPDVLGNITTTLAPVSAAWAGTFVDTASGDRTATLSSTLGEHTASFTGATASKLDFEISVRIGVAWQFAEEDFFTGTAEPTLDAFTAALTGQFTAAGALVATVATALDDAAATFAGTVTAASSVTGTISSDLRPITASIDGFSLFADAIGTANPVLDPATASFTGTVETPVYTGTVTTSLDSMPAAFTAASFPAGVVIGPVARVLDAFTPAVFGTFVPLGGVIPVGPQLNEVPYIISRVYRLVSHDFTEYLKNPADGPFTWVANAPLPAGMTLDPATGIVSGTSSTIAKYAGITLTVTNSRGSTDTNTFTWAVAKSVPRGGTMNNPNKVTIVGL